jgi:HEAT repeats
VGTELFHLALRFLSSNADLVRPDFSGVRSSVGRYDVQESPALTGNVDAVRAVYNRCPDKKCDFSQREVGRAILTLGNEGISFQRDELQRHLSADSLWLATDLASVAPSLMNEIRAALRQATASADGPRSRISIMQTWIELGANVDDVLPTLLEIANSNDGFAIQAVDTMDRLVPKASEASLNTMAAALAHIAGRVKPCFKPEFQSSLCDQAGTLLSRLGDFAAKHIAQELSLASSNRKRLLSVVKEMGPSAKDTAPQVARLIQDSGVQTDPGILMVALDAISAIGPGAAPCVDALTKLLQSRDPRVREKSLDALRAIGPSARDALPALRNLMAHGDKKQKALIGNVIEKIEAEQ